MVCSDCRIRELEEKLQRMRAVQDQLNELAAVQHSNLELERDVERSVSLMMMMMIRILVFCDVEEDSKDFDADGEDLDYCGVDKYDCSDYNDH